MTVVNFTHPLTPFGREALDRLMGHYELVEIKVQIDWDQDVKKQLDRLVEEALSNGVQWIIPPALSSAAAYITARLVQAKMMDSSSSLGVIVVGKVQDWPLPIRFEPMDAYWLVKHGRIAE